MKKNYTWPEHRDRCSKSGMSKLAYCKLNGLSYQMFLYHLKKFSSLEDLGKFHEVILAPQEVSVEPRQELQSDQIIIEFCSGARLYFPERCLERVCETLNKHRSC